MMKRLRQSLKIATRRIRPYFSIFRIQFQNSLQYRAVVLGGILKTFCWAFMVILAYAALYRTNPDAFPMEFSQMVSYIWIQQSLFTLFRVVFGDADIYATISEGAIAYEMVRPVNLYGRWFSKSAATRLAFTIVNCMPVLILALILPKPYGLTLPESMVQLILFLVSVVLAFLIVVSFAMLMYISLFYTISHRGIRIIVTAFTSFLSGEVVPLLFFPEVLGNVVNWLPFAAMANMPLQIYCGSIAGTDAVNGILFQIFWLVTLVGAGQFAMRKSLGRVVVQGG